MPPGATVQTAKAARTCPDCHRPIESPRRYCDRDRDRRRAITFLNQANTALAPHAGAAGIDAAHEHVIGALEELGG